jgi:AcrR family transcriptional regulator
VRKQERSINRFDQIVDGALQLFVERGYDNAPLSAVADQLGLTKAGLYHHFATKEDLLFVAHQRAMERQLLPLLEELEAERDAEQRLRKFIFEHARTLAREPATGLLIREARRLAPAHLAEIKKSWRRGLNILRDSIVELQSAGRCRSDIDPTHAAFAAIGMTNWIPFWFDPMRPEAADSMARMMQQLFMNGLLHREARRPAQRRAMRVSYQNTAAQNTAARKRVSRS